jgi:prepilin-type N-terminal cleavage/methylation domain-containing protein
MRARGGMTLMELVIGLAITGIMAAAGVAAFGSIIDHRRVIRDASAATERAAALRETIRSWTVGGNVRIQLSGVPRGLTRTAARGQNQALGGMSAAAVTPAQGSGDDLTITTSAQNPAMTASLTIRLYVDSDGSTPEHGLTMEYQPAPTQPLVRTMLDSTIDSLKVEYLDGRTHRWIAASQAATIGNVLAFRVTMIPNPSSHPSPLIGLPMVFARGLGAPTGGQGQ